MKTGPIVDHDVLRAYLDAVQAMEELGGDCQRRIWALQSERG